MNVKYKINGQSLWRYLHEKGFTDNKAKAVYWRINNKNLSPEEAINFKMPPAGDRKQQQLQAGRRFRGYTNDELLYTREQAKERGYLKQVKKLYHGKRLGEWAKESGISHGCLWWRVEKMGMSIKEAVALGKRQTLTYQGKTAYQWFGKGNYSFVYDRIKKGWSIDDAFTIPPDSDWKNKSFEQRGVRPKFKKIK